MLQSEPRNRSTKTKLHFPQPSFNRHIIRRYEMTRQLTQKQLNAISCGKWIYDENKKKNNCKITITAVNGRHFAEWWTLYIYERTPEDTHHEPHKKRIKLLLLLYKRDKE